MSQGNTGYRTRKLQVSKLLESSDYYSKKSLRLSSVTCIWNVAVVDTRNVLCGGVFVALLNPSVVWDLKLKPLVCMLLFFKCPHGIFKDIL